MKPRNTLILLILFVVLATVVFFLERPGLHESETAEVEPTLFFPELQPDSVDRITLDSDESSIELRRSAEGWLVPDGDVEYPADARLVDNILEKVQELTKEELVSQNPDNRELFQVDESGLEVRFFSGEQTAAHLFLGKNGPDFFSTYVREAEEDSVYLIADYLRGDFGKPVRNWKDRSPLKAEKEEIQSIEIQRRDDGVLRFQRAEGEDWTLTAEGRTLPAKTTEMNRLLAGLSNFLAADYAETTDPEVTGLADPAVRVTITLLDGTSQTALLGAETEKSRYFVAREGSEWVLLMPKHRYDLLVKPVVDYQAPTPVPTVPVPEGAGEETPEPEEAGS